MAPLDEMASLDSLDFLVLLVPLGPPDPLALEETLLPRCPMAMMGKLASPAVLVSVDLLDLRVLVDCLEQLASLE